MDAKSQPGTGGWPIAIGVTVLAIVLTLTAFTIHKRTYCAPSHPLCHAISAEEHAPAHEAAEPAH